MLTDSIGLLMIVLVSQQLENKVKIVYSYSGSAYILFNRGYGSMYFTHCLLFVLDGIPSGFFETATITCQFPKTTSGETLGHLLKIYL